MLHRIARNLMFVTAVTALTMPLLLTSAAAFVALSWLLDFVWSILIWLPLTLLLIAVWAALMERIDPLSRLMQRVQQVDADAPSE